ncbi:MAG: hypothetical protein KHX55_00510 [Proteobacteria bacterium]|nr:hypothetical protein [Pseudomonadota bacterium]
MQKINKLNQQLNNVLEHVVNQFKRQNISIVMPTYIPQRGEILREFASRGVETAISGGIRGAQCFKEIPQFGMEEDTLPYTDGFPEYITRRITNLLPEERLKNRKVAVFSYVNNLGWSRHIEERGLNTEIVATVEQNLRGYFEEKGNLLKILDTAGLSAYKIPTRHVSHETPVDELIEVYEAVKNEDGRVVVQDCCSENGNAGGKGTLFIDSCEEFVKDIINHKGRRKVARFINGFESNLSFFAGNTQADENMFGAAKMNLTPQMDAFNPDTLDALLQQAQAAGINESNIVTVVGRGTLKAVGDEYLTSGESNGVGNDVGYVYPENIRRQISEIGTKLSRLMALSGKVGIAGADLIVDKNGKVWINEINDRQQGPTAQMSKDAESSGIPSLLKISLLSSFGDFKKPEIQQVFRELQQNSEALHEAYATNPGEFYLKVHSTHPKGRYEEVRRNLRPGFYEIKRGEDGRWRFDFASYKNPNSNTEYQTNPAEGRVVVKLVGGDWKTGDKVDNASQLFRLTGITNPDNPPFVIEDGKTRLNKSWQPVVEACYNYMFGEGYIRKNPLWQQRHKNDYRYAGWCPVAKRSQAFTPANQNNIIRLKIAAAGRK